MPLFFSCLNKLPLSENNFLLFLKENSLFMVMLFLIEPLMSNSMYTSYIHYFLDLFL